MPVFTDLNDLARRFEVQNQDELSKYNVYFVMNTIKRQQQKQVWNYLFADRKWQANMGPTMQGVRLEPTPITRQFFRPNAITARAAQDMFDQQESQERATVRWHKYRSRQIYFLRNFQDFIADQIKPAQADIDDKILYGQELFLRTAIWDRCPLVYVCKQNGDPLVGAPHSGPPNYTASPKNQNWLADQIDDTVGHLTPERLDNIYHCAKEELGIYPMDGAGANAKMPKENDPLEGQFCVLMSGEAYGSLRWTPGFDKLRAITNDQLHKRFMGALFGDLMVKAEYLPIRFAEDGSTYEPQIVDENKELVPNPQYAKLANSPIEVGFFIGGEVASAIEIGPPPREFAGGASSKKVTGMNWNGKTSITDELLIYDADQDIYDYNSDKEFLRIQGTATHAVLPKRARNILPFFFRRRRVSEIAA